MATRKMFSDLEIVNQALTGMGEDPIQNLAEDTKQALIMRTHYDAVREFNLTRSSWRFATTKKALGLLSGAPVNRWSHAWQLPEDLLKVLFVWPPSSYEIQGNRLFINAASGVELDYIRMVPEAEWLPWFTRLVVAELIKRTVKGITGSDPSVEQREEAEAALSDAYFQDAQQQPNQTLLPNAFIDVRH